jgi:hypothetical protein
VHAVAVDEEERRRGARRHGGDATPGGSPWQLPSSAGLCACSV